MAPRLRAQDAETIFGIGIGHALNEALSATPAFARGPHAELAAFGGVDSKQPNMLAMDFDSVTIDDGSDTYDLAWLRGCGARYEQAQCEEQQSLSHPVMISASIICHLQQRS
jgi:hypothetical protein